MGVVNLVLPRLELGCLSPRLERGAFAPIGVREAGVGCKLEVLEGSEPESRVRCNCWLMMDIEDCRGGEARYGEESPELLLGRAMGRCVVLVIPKMSE